MLPDNLLQFAFVLELRFVQPDMMNLMDMDNEKWSTLLSWPDNDRLPVTDSVPDHSSSMGFNTIFQ